MIKTRLQREQRYLAESKRGGGAGGLRLAGIEFPNHHENACDLLYSVGDERWETKVIFEDVLRL